MHNLGEVFRSKRYHLEFVLRFRDYLNEQEDCILVNPSASLDKNANDRCLIDKVVYSPNRNIRLVYSSKPGGVNLVPVPFDSEMASAASADEVLWASLPSYSMPADESTYFAFSTYTRTNEESKEEELSTPKKTRTSTAVGTRTNDTLVSALVAGTDSSRRRNSKRTALLPEQIKQIVLKLDVSKRIQSDRSEWVRLVWATKGAWPEEQWPDGLAFMQEMAKQCKPTSMRPSRLECLWRDRHQQAYNAGTLYKMLKQDVSADEYRELLAVRLQRPVHLRIGRQLGRLRILHPVRPCVSRLRGHLVARPTPTRLRLLRPLVRLRCMPPPSLFSDDLVRDVRRPGLPAHVPVRPA